MIQLRAVVLAVLVLAGCVGPDSAETSIDEADTVSDDLGAIEGLLTDDSLSPLGGADVVLDGSTATFTDAAGVFRFDLLPPGPHEIVVALEGYGGASRVVEVSAGNVERVQMQLVPVAAGGYVDTLVLEGLAGCSASYTVVPSQEYSVTNYSLFPCTFLFLAGLYSVDEANLLWDVGSLDEMTGFISETSWQSSQALGRQMRVIWGHWLDKETFQAQAFQYGAGSSPYRARIPVEMVKEMLANETHTVEDCVVEQCTLMSIHYSGPDGFVAGQYGIGVQFQQRFTEYVHIFRGRELPEDYSVLPDQ